MTKTTFGLVAAIVLLAVLVSVGPVLVALIEAAVPLVIAVGVVGAALRILWLVTERYR